MAPLDQYAPYLLAALVVTAVGLGLYTAYIHSRLAGSRQELARIIRSDQDQAA